MYGRGRSAKSAKPMFGPFPGSPNYLDFWKGELAYQMEEMKKATEAKDVRLLKLASKYVREAKAVLAEAGA